VNVLPALGNLGARWKRDGSVRLRDEDGVQFRVYPLMRDARQRLCGDLTQ